MSDRYVELCAALSAAEARAAQAEKDRADTQFKWEGTVRALAGLIEERRTLTTSRDQLMEENAVLRSQVENADATWAQQKASTDAARAEVDRLKGALGPFAAAALELPTSLDDARPLYAYGTGPVITAGHLRAARAALSAPPRAPEPGITEPLCTCASRNTDSIAHSSDCRVWEYVRGYSASRAPHSIEKK